MLISRILQFCKNNMDVLKGKSNISVMTFQEAGIDENNLKITYEMVPSEFGKLLVATHDRRICYLAFVDPSIETALTKLRDKFKKADIIEGNVLDDIKNSSDVKLLLKGTDLEVQVWNELLKIPEGTTATYSDLASAVGKPSAVRAVASAIGRNPILYLIPCHRVLRKNGELGGYLGGLQKKIEILSYEGVKI